MQSAAVSFCRDILLNLANIFLRFEPGKHYLMAAAQTFQSKVGTCPQNFPPGLSAGVGFFHDKDIPNLNIHAFSPLIAAQYCFAACSSLLFP